MYTKLKFMQPLLIILLSSLVQMYIAVVILTKEEFNLAVTSNRYLKPKDEVYRYFNEYAGNFTREEAAMFIAQLIHESGGFKHTEQLECINKANHCKGMYDDGAGLPDKSYHGRGYIQLTWAANYRVASIGLGMGDRLLKHPELVAEDKRLAMKVSVWYWEARVRPLLKGKEDSFGLTTKGINPGECPTLKFLARRRYRIYLNVAEALEIRKKAKEIGCYN